MTKHRTDWKAPQLRAAIALADKYEQELAERRSQLVPTADVIAAFDRARAIWRGIPDQILACADSTAAQLLIDTEIRRGLAELEQFAAKLERDAGGDAGDTGDDGGDGDGGSDADK